jgi:hypothetical protein
MVKLPSIFGKKEEEVKVDLKEKMAPDLDKLCGNDKETYEALVKTMFVDPRKVGVSMEEAAENAKKLEKNRELTKAVMWYRTAGALAIYENNPKKVEEYFSKAEKLSPERKYPIVKNAEKAVAVAQEYYKKHLTSEPK